MRKAAIGAVMALAGLSLTATRLAADEPGDDLRCLVVSLQMVGSTTPAAQSAGLAASFYWMGRVDSRVATAELEDRMMAELKSLSADALQSEARRCGAELMTRGMAMKDIGQDMQRRGAEMEKNENTR